MRTFSDNNLDTHRGLEWESVSLSFHATRPFAFVLDDAGTWIVGFDDGVVVGPRGIRETLRGRDASAKVLAASGTLDGLMATIERGDRGVQLAAFAARLPVRAMAVVGAASFTALAAWTDSQWFAVGSDAAGAGLAGLYDPLGFAFHPLAGPSAGPWTCVASRPEVPVAIMGGTDGRAVFVSPSGAVHESTGARGTFRAAAPPPRSLPDAMDLVRARRRALGLTADLSHRAGLSANYCRRSSLAGAT